LPENAAVFPGTHISREIAALELERISLESDMAELERRISFYRTLEAELEKAGLQQVFG